MMVLGITDSITSGATLVADGRVIAAVSEERLNREKMAMGFPWRSIEAVLKIAAVDVSDIDHVAVATNSLFWRPEPIKLEDYFRSSKGGLTRDIFLAAGSLFAKWSNGSPVGREAYYHLKSYLTRGRRDKIRAALAERWRYDRAVSFVDHHLAHCASAYFTSGLGAATVISLDGAGDGCSSHVYRVDDGRFRLLHKVDSYDSLGNYYAYVTHLCGFKAHHHEGKVTGLAAFGKPTYVDLLKRYIEYRPGTMANVGGCFDWSAIRKLERDLGSGFSVEDLASSVQAVLEEIATEYIDYWVRRAECPDLAVAGGVFANVKLNQRVHELDSVRSLFVHPGMGDEGLATGAALLRCFQLGQKTDAGLASGSIQDVYWGLTFSPAEMEAALRSSGYAYRRPADIEAEVGRLLAEGHIVARFDGQMEYGPRALGNRSILYQATDTAVNEWLNKKLRRSEFMPFAPVTLKEHTGRCYRGTAGAEVSAKFMTVTFDCTPWMKDRCPAVVHVDGTARPQLIDRETNPRYYRIIHEYYKRTGLPSIVNTSFNMHEEPIVCTPADAVRSVVSSKLEYLAMGDFLLSTGTPSGSP